MADLTLYIRGDSSGAIKHLQMVKQELAQIAKLAGVVNQIYAKKDASGAAGGVGKSPVSGIAEDAEKVTRDVKKQAVAAKEAVASVGAQWQEMTLSQQANIRKWGAVSTGELKKAISAQEKLAQDANKLMTQRGGFNWLTGEQSGKSGKDMAEAYKAVDRTNKEIEKVVRRDIAAQEKLVAARDRPIEKERAQLAKRLKQQVAFGDKYMQSVGKAAQQHGIHVDPAQARGGLQVLAGGQAQWDKHRQQGVFVKTKQDAEALTKSLEGLGFAVKNQQSALRGFATEVGSMMRTQARWFAGAGLIFTAMASVGAATRSTMEFYQNLKNIQAITGTTEAGIRAVGQAAMDVALSTPVAAREASQFALKLIQAGLEAEEASIAMRTVAELVTVTGESSDEISKTVTTAMFAWRKEAEDIPAIGQAIAAALNFSRLTVQDLGVAFNYLASTSSLMGKSLEETTAIMAVLNNMGIRASTIGTGISMLFTELTVPSKKARAEMERLGISLNKINPSLNKFADIVDTFKEKGFSAAQAMSVFQIRAGRQLAAALVVGGDAFRNMEERIARSTQLTEGLAKAKEGPINRLKEMRNQLEVTAIQIGAVSIPIIDALTLAVKVLGGILRNVTSGISAFVDIIGNKFTPYVILGAGAVGLGALAFSKYTVGAKLATAATVGFTKSLHLLWAAMRKHPLIAIISVAAIALAALGKFWKKYGQDLEAMYNANKKRQDLGAREHELMEQRMRLEEQAVVSLREEWGKLGQAGARVGVLVEVRGLIDGFHLISQAVRGANLEIEILEKKLAELKPESGKGPLRSFFDWMRLPRDLEGFATQDSVQPTGGKTGGVLGAITKAGNLTPEELAERRNEIFDLYQKLGKEDERRAKLIAEGFAVGDKLLGKKWSVKDAIIEAIAIPEMTEIDKFNRVMGDLQQEWDSLREKLGQAKQELVDFQKTYREATASPEQKKRHKELEGDYQNLVAALGAVEKKTSEVATMAGGEIKIRIADAAEKAKDALKTVQAEFKRFRFELGQVGRDDPFADIFIRGQEEADKLSRRIQDMEREIGKKESERKKAGGLASHLKIDEHIKALQEQKKILEEQKGLIPGKTEAELRVKANEIILDQTRQQIQLEQELGRLSPIDALNREIEADRHILALETMRLEVQKELAKGDEKRLEALRLFEQALDGRKRIQELKEEAGRIKTMNAEYARAQEALDLLGTMGGDVSLSKEYLDFHQKMNNIIKTRPELADMARASLSRMYDAMTWMDRPPSGEAWNGFLMNLRIGVEQGYQGLGNAFEHVERIGVDAVNSLQRSSSDFFYKLSTAEGFDPSEHENFWEYFKDVVDDFLKSVYQSFMRTLADIWSQWLTKGIINMLNGVLDGKNAIASSDAQAAAQSAGLTGALSAQIGVVSSLTSAYWALAVAKAAAGMGSMGEVKSVDPSFTSGNIATSRGSFHTGGLVMHNGGLVPRYHSGGRIRHDEKLALLQTGEFVISRRGVKTLDAINRGDVSAMGGQPSVTNVTILAADARSFSDMVRRNPDAITGAVTRDMRHAGPTRQSIRQFG